MGKVFIVDQALCNGCYGCQIACKDETVGNEWPPYSKSQPVTGQFWCKMLQKDHGQVPKVRVEYKPTFCNHCDGAPCMAAFPDAVYKRDDGLVIIDPEKAAGARGLVEACPYGAVYWNEELELPQKCTGCAHLVDEGKVPHCVDVCVTGALRFGDEEDFAEEIAAAEVVPAEGASGQRVYYLNAPGLFIGGEVWDPADDEVIEGARVTLSFPDGSAAEELTDGFGDFWFRRLSPGAYRLSIEADGFRGVERDVELAESLNVGDFPLERA